MGKGLSSSAVNQLRHTVRGDERTRRDRGGVHWDLMQSEGGGGFVGRLTECPDETHRIGVVHKLTGNPFSTVPEEAGEESEDIEVICPPGMLTDLVRMTTCYVGYADGCTPNWIVQDIIDYDPAVAATGDSTGITTGTLAEHQLQMPPEECGS